jgi:hypothetical protein
MIIGVPDHNEPNETANGWLNLGWEITIGTLTDFHEFKQYVEFREEDQTAATAQHAECYWHAQR